MKSRERYNNKNTKSNQTTFVFVSFYLFLAFTLVKTTTSYNMFIRNTSCTGIICVFYSFNNENGSF